MLAIFSNNALATSLLVRVLLYFEYSHTLDLDTNGTLYCFAIKSSY